jgi:mannose-6-phosphate isomerase-like protein (cupin superfamily)
MTSSRQDKAQIFNGTEQPLSEVPDHFDIPGITRYLMMDNQMVRGKSFHIATHEISDAYICSETHHYTVPHTHDFDEVNLLISSENTLVYEFQLNDTVETIEAPACIYVPAGVKHDSKALRGTGTFVCIQLDAHLATDQP